MPDDRDIRNPLVPPAHVRAQTAPPVEEIEEEVTGQHSGEELRKMRARRTTGERVDRLEVKHDHSDAKIDAHGERIGKLEVVVADFGGQMKILPDLVDTMKSATNALQRREDVTFTAKVGVHSAQALEEIEVGKAGKLDVIHAKQTRRERWTKILGIAAGGGGLIEILHRIF